MASSDLQMAFQVLSEKLDVERTKIQEEAAEAKRETEAAQAELQAKRTRLENEIKEFEQRLQQFQEEKDAMTLGQPADVLELNIGGQKKLSVLRSTLCAFPQSMLASSFSGRWDAQLTKDAQGCFFIDFSPDVFEPLVDYLRQARLSSPSEDIPWATGVPKDKLQLFNKMANYFGILDPTPPPRYVCSRLQKIGQLGVWTMNGATDCIVVTVDSPISLLGLQVFGPMAPCADAWYEGDIEVYKCRELVWTQEVRYIVPPPETKGELLFKSPLQMEAHIGYTISLSVKGPDAQSGEYIPYKPIIANGVTFKFTETVRDPVRSSNGTDAKLGQIPGLIFS